MINNKKHNLLKIGNRVLKIGSRVLTAPLPEFDYVKIGNQIWMSKNLSIDDGQGGIVTQTVNYGQGDVVEHYYTWDAAVRVADSIEGWRLPTVADLNTLAATVGGESTAGTKLKSTYGWGSGNGTDDYGFSAFPPGRYIGYFQDLGYRFYFWTSNEYSSTHAYIGELSNFSDLVWTRYQKILGYSVRLIKEVN